MNNAFLRALGNGINQPFLILDRDGNIKSRNTEATSLFPFNDEHLNLFEILSPETDSSLNELIEISFENNSAKSGDLSFKLANGTEFNAKITVETFKDDNEIFVLLVISSHNNEIELKGITDLKLMPVEAKDIINSETILKTIEEIKSLFPFTFIGKERVKKLVNRFEELFWIKDTKGKYILVNDKLAANLGLKESQIEGKPVDAFLQPYLIEFTFAIDKYIRDSVNCVVLEGIPFSGIMSGKEYQTIQVPLIDADKNVIAIIGIGQHLSQDNLHKVKSSALEMNENLFSNFSRPVVIFDKDGNIKHNSLEFCKLFRTELNDLRGYNFSGVLPPEVWEKIKRFIESGNFSEKLDLNVVDKDNENEALGYYFYLDKISFKENAFEGFSLFIEKQNIDGDIENLIKRRGRMFEILIQNNPEPMFIYDKDNLKFLEVNDAALALYGFRRDEFLQMDLTDLYTPEDIQTLLDSSKVSLKEGKFSGPFKHKKKDGSSIFVEISKITFNYQDKSAHFNIIRDVTEKLELEKNNQLFKTAFENTGDLLFITDNVGIITYINDSVKDILGYKKGELDRTSITALVPNEERGTLNSSVYQSHIKENISLNIPLKKSGGNFIETELTASPILNYKGDVESFGIIGKITRPEAREPEIREVIKEVIKEVEVEKPVVVEKTVYVEKSIPSESIIIRPTDVNFLSNLFHEILTPINVILGFVQELTDGIENLSPEQKEVLGIINQNRDRLLNTMNSVIEYSNIEKSDFQVNPEEVAITEIIDTLYNEFKEIIGSRDIEFAYGKISSSLKFVTDKHRFQTLVGMLVKIATYICKDKKIYFSAYLYGENNFAVSIKDNYAFVSTGFLENLVNIFEKDETALIKDFGISKLTLKLTRSLLNLLNGKFEVIEQKPEKRDYAFVFPINLAEAIEKLGTAKDKGDSSEPAGVVEETRTEKDSAGEDVKLDTGFEEHEEIIENITEDFAVDGDILALKGQTAPAPQNKKANNLYMKSLSCLYIEDQVDSQILFKVQMKELKEIKFAVSFEEALPLLDNTHFDFIVMDINLQGEYNGLDALKIIHKMPGYENIPILAVTAYVLPGDKEKFIATGFNDFISKPIFREKMIDSLERIFLMQP